MLRVSRGGLPITLGPADEELKADFEMTPDEAFDAPSEPVAAEMVSFYPPGIPRIVLGQRITEAQAAYLCVDMKYGAFPYDASDLGLKTVRCVA